MKAKIIWINKNNPNVSEEGKVIRWQSEDEIRKHCEELNKKWPELKHSYKIIN